MDNGKVDNDRVSSTMTALGKGDDVGYPQKLTEKQKAEITEALKDPAVKVTDIAEKYGVKKSTVYKYLPPERKRADWRIDGRVFGKWTVLRYDKDGSNSSDGRYWCRCECGTERSVLRRDLFNGKSTMCMKCRGEEEGGKQT